MNGTRHTGTSVAVYKDLKEQILHLELPPGSAISEIGRRVPCIAHPGTGCL